MLLMKKILMLAVLSVAIFAGCQKADFDSTVTGEALGTFTLNALQPMQPLF